MEIKNRSILDRVRQWIDGDSAERVLEQAARDAQVKPRSKAEEFIVKIARAVEAVMQTEMVPLPQGTTIIPSEYAIFLSEEDDREWRGVKRQGLEQGLYHILAERARELAGRKKLDTTSFTLELRIDGTLEKGNIRVQHSWEDSVTSKTGVLPRLNPEPGIEPHLKKTMPTDPNMKLSAGRSKELKPLSSSNQSGSLRSGIQQAEPLPTPEQADEMTAVKTRAPELYRLEVWRHNVRQNVIPVYQKEIVVGRGSKSKPVDIPLAGDVEISRRHLMLITDGDDNFWVVNEGKNATELNNFELPSGQRVPIQIGTPLTVCSYMLRIQR